MGCLTKQRAWGDLGPRVRREKRSASKREREIYIEIYAVGSITWPHFSLFGSITWPS